jgi:hypothetical protein
MSRYIVVKNAKISYILEWREYYIELLTLEVSNGGQLDSKRLTQM